VSGIGAGSGQPVLPLEDDLSWWSKYSVNEVSGPPIMSHTFSAGFGKVVSRMWEGRRLDGAGPPGVGVLRIRSGWPLESMECSRWLVEPFLPREVVKHAISIPGPPYSVGQENHLPLRPLLPGFAINTIFYAVILWILWSSPFTARGMIRRKRGLCIKCGYDLRGAEHAACPECGRELCDKDKP